MRFTKMHGIGNDYVYVNCFEEQIDNPEHLARLVSDRHFGVGSDGLILICPCDNADIRMRMFNADGSEAEMCGNGIRCLAKYTVDHGISASKPLDVETGNGIRTIDYEVDQNGKMVSATVNMGEPILAPADIPVNIDAEHIVNHEVQIAGETYNITCASMGNPHVVIFCDDVEAVNLGQVGPIIENDSMFPQRINVHFVSVNSRSELTMRTWERGSGITLACGTGACSVCVAGVLNEYSNRNCLIHLPGGDLTIDWCEKDNCVYMTGPATEVFDGDWPI